MRRGYLIGGGVLLAAAIAILVALVVTGGNEAASPKPTTTTAPPTTTTSVPGVVAPLTGLPVHDASVLDRPALIVKIDNVDSYARPQAGINQADVVFEEVVEGGVTRFAAVFHSREAPLVGPVRSARSTDIAIASALRHPLFAFSGANAVFLQLVRAAPLVDLSYDYHPQLYNPRRADRTAPDNIFTPTSKLRAATPPGQRPPAPLFVYRVEGDPLGAGSKKVTGVSWSTGGAGVPVTFTWSPEKKAWLRQQNGTPHVDEDGHQIAPVNVIVQFVEYHNTGLVDLSGTPVPEAKLVGEGDAWVFTNGHLVKAHWTKPDATTPTRYVDAAHHGIRLTPGQTWVALLPAGEATINP